MLSQAITEENIKKGEVIGVRKGVCSILKTNLQFLKPYDSIFNAEFDYLEGATVEFETPDREEAVKTEVENIGKLIKLGSKLTSKDKKKVKSLISQKIIAIGSTC